MPSATPAAAGAGLPVAAAGVVAAASQSAVDPAFDDVFRQLTGGLLTTSAEAGEAMAKAELSDIVAGESGPDGPAADALPFAVVPVPAIVTLPVLTTPPSAVTEGDGSHVEAEAAAGLGTGSGPSGGTGAAPAAPGGPVFANAATFNATPAEAGPFEHDAAGGDATGTTQVAEAPGGLATLTPAANAAGAATPATDVEAPARELGRRRGMRETPAGARTFDTGAVETGAGAPTQVAPAAARQAAPGTTDTPAVTAAAPAETSGPASRELPATAERVFALQRALARQSENTHHDGLAPGLAAQVAQHGAVAAGGAETGAGDTPHDTKQGHASTTSPAPGKTLPALATAGATAPPPAAAGFVPALSAEPSGPGPAARATWHAAALPSALLDRAGLPPDTVRAPAAPDVVVSPAPALEPIGIRDRGPLVAETAMAIPDLDAATGESVHAQIVRSIRLQWTGSIGEARVTLKPEYLGEVTASIKVEHGAVTATLHADTPEVRRWMESHTATLRDALVDHGLKLDRLTVGEPDRQATPGDRQSKPRQQPRQPAPRQRGRREASETDTPFEVTPD